jgi:magnesium-transporting ATPase (P-type)
MIPLLHDDTDRGLLRKTREHIDLFSKEGLRTLIVAKREISNDEYEVTFRRAAVTH